MRTAEVLATSPGGGVKETRKVYGTSTGRPLYVTGA